MVTLLTPIESPAYMYTIRDKHDHDYTYEFHIFGINDIEDALAAAMEATAQNWDDMEVCAIECVL